MRSTAPSAPRPPEVPDPLDPGRDDTADIRDDARPQGGRAKNTAQEPAKDTTEGRAGQRRSRLRAAMVTGAGGLVVAMLLTGVAALLPGAEPVRPPAASPAELHERFPELPVSPVSVTQAVAALQARLQRLPGDHRSWARLGAAYVQQARITADPSYYPKAEQALAKAAALAPDDPDVLTGQAALAAGRHEFDQAVRLADRAIAANPYGAAAHGVRADALTQLGRYDEATKAINRMMDLRPGVASFTRASYDAELRGDTAKAEDLLGYALRDALAPEDVAYCRYYLGELALHAGDTARAAREYDAALAAAPDYVPALAGRARALALSGRPAEAADGYRQVVNRLPLAQYLVEYGEVLIRLGRDPSGQWTLLEAQRRLMDAAGVRDDLTWAEFEADHGSAERAVRHARAEYARNPNLVAADALAWALHRAGRSKEALKYAKEATSTGWRNALSHHHRAVIERALGRTGDARRSAALVKEINPRFDPELPALARFS